METVQAIIDIELKLVNRLIDLNFGPKVEYIYNPLGYAFDVHKVFLEKSCSSNVKKILFLGMNPGPWGMMQNGVPFGEVNSVRDFLNISGTINKPEKEHPSRPVLGLHCKRSEVSGKRFWSLASLLGAGEADIFFKNSFVYNYFPLCLLSGNGKNVTPPELKVVNFVPFSFN